MRAVGVFLSGLALACGAAADVHAQSAEWKKLNAETMSLYRQGDYDRAADVAKRALSVAERTMGPDHATVASSLNNLAQVYKTQGLSLIHI